MVGSLSAATMRTLVSGALAPSLEISSGGKCVKATVDDEFHCAFWKIIDVRIPCDIIISCCSDLQIFSLNNQPRYAVFPALVSVYSTARLSLICSFTAGKVDKGGSSNSSGRIW